MAPRPTQRQNQIFKALIAKLEPSLRRAFTAAVEDWRAGIDIGALIDALRRVDIDAAIGALNLDPAAFTAFMQAKTAAYVEGGTTTVAMVNVTPQERIRIRFDMSNPVAEQWISENVGQRVRDITSEQVQNVRTAIYEGYAKGEGPDTIARRLSGKVELGKRRGGLVGLSGPQYDHVASMRARLESGDPAELRKVIDGMTLRDRRFDPAINKAIRNGTPLTGEQIDAMTQRYSDRLLAKRANDIARTETGQAVMAGRADEWRMAAQKLGLDEGAIEKTWIFNAGTLGGYRDYHLEMNNKTVVGLNTPFIFSDRVAKQYALDGNGGAKHDANCRCGTSFRLNRAIGLV